MKERLRGLKHVTNGAQTKTMWESNSQHRPVGIGCGGVFVCAHVCVRDPRLDAELFGCLHVLAPMVPPMCHLTALKSGQGQVGHAVAPLAMGKCTVGGMRPPLGKDSQPVPTLQYMPRQHSPSEAHSVSRLEDPLPKSLPQSLGGLH